MKKSTAVAASAPTQRQRASAVMNEINGMMKSNVVKLASDQHYAVTYTPTGLLPFDLIMPGGVPRGRFIEFYGGPSTLKSYAALCAIAEHQRQGNVAALIDTERTFDPEWAESIGVDLQSLIMLPKGVDTGEQAFDVAEVMLRSNEVSLLVFDSVAAAQPQIEAGKPMFETKIQPGQHAKMMSVGLRKLTAANTHTSVIFINQTRMNIGVTFGSPEVTTGGKALPFYASMRMKISQSGKEYGEVEKRSIGGKTLKEVKSVVGQWYTIEMVKSKLSKPMGTTTFLWDLNTGTIDVPRFLFAEGLNEGVITQTGTRYDIAGTVVNGKDASIDYIRANPNVGVELEWAIREVHNTVAVTPEAAMIRTAVPKPVREQAQKPRRRIIARRPG